MKILRRCLIWVSVACLLVLIFVGIWIKTYGQPILRQALAGALNTRVEVASVVYQFPLGVTARGLTIARSAQGGDFLSVDRVDAGLSLASVMQRALHFRFVVLRGPVVVLESSDKTSLGLERRYGVVVPPGEGDSPEGEKGQIKAAEHQGGGVRIDRLTAQGGRLKYTGSIAEQPWTVNFEDLQGKVWPVAFPAGAGRSEFMISARLVKEGHPLSGGDVSASGWMDLDQKDMEAKVEIVEPDGNVGLTARAVSAKNDVTVNGDVQLKNILGGLPEKVPSEAGSVNDLVLNALASSGVEIGAKFSFKTKMDDFQISEVSFSGNVVTK